MTFRKLTIPLLLILVLIFSYGCFKKVVEEEKSEKQAIPEAIQEAAPETSGNFDAEDILGKVKNPTKQTSEEKTAIYKKAQENLDPVKCDELENFLAIQNCKQNIIIKEAIQKKDPTLCDTLEGEGDREYCKKRTEGKE